MGKYFISFSLFFLFFAMQTVCAQVTIGSGIKPVDGAILDLKEYDSAGTSTSTKGLLLPRVLLTDLNTLVDIDRAEGESKTVYTGMLVYNVNKKLCENIKPGVYAWGGDAWSAIGRNGSVNGVTDLVDIRAGKQETYKVAQFKVDLPDGRKYDAGWWMLEDLRATSYANGQTAVYPLTEGKAGVPNSHECFYSVVSFPQYPADKSYVYNYQAYTNGLDNASGDINNKPSRKRQGICPNGWRLPTYEDWLTLYSVLGLSGCEFSRPKAFDPVGQRAIGFGNGFRPRFQGDSYRTSLQPNDGGLDFRMTDGYYDFDADNNPVADPSIKGMTMMAVMQPIPLPGGGIPIAGYFAFNEVAFGTKFHPAQGSGVPVRCVKSDVLPAVRKDKYAQSSWEYLDSLSDQ